MPLLLLALLALSAVLPRPAVAQLEEGRTVRVVERSGAVWSGRVAGVDHATLVLVTPDGARVISRDSVERVEVRFPRSRAAGALRGGAIGVSVGAATGAAVWAVAAGLSECQATTERPADLACFTTREAALLGCIVGGHAGALGGAAAGLLFPGARWERAAVRPVVAVGSGGELRAGVEIAF